MRILTLLFFAFLACQCSQANRDNAAAADAGANTVSASFQVWGNCGMCEKTIEKGAKAAGAIAADWNEDNDNITVQFDPAKTSLEAIHAGIAAVGYDTDQRYGDDAAYYKLPECCQYDRRERGQ
jgi:mercuric ion binding protein